MTPIFKNLTHHAVAGFFALAVVAPTLAHANGEPYRPAVHFTPDRNWINDPNGLVYYDGEYHLFFQYTETSINGGWKSWGHAVSRDLLRWEELPVALSPYDGISIFSGSAVIDWDNTSGFGVDGKPPMVAFYTGHAAVEDQRVAYSNDRGRTWTHYSGNPVINLNNANFRDPDVFWHEESGKWIMTVSLATQRKVHFYSSSDLKSWTQVGEFGNVGPATGIWECPDLFPIEVEGQPGVKKWILAVSAIGGSPAGGWGTQYFVGNFDGATFTDQYPAGSELPAGDLISDFEGTTFTGWTKTGTAFGAGPVTGPLPNQQGINGFRGARFANSFHGGDTTMGTLVSEPFTLSRNWLNFLIAGGNHAGQTCVNLKVGGTVVRSATGKNSESLEWRNWDVTEFAGQQATLEIVDTATGGWGHVLADHFLLADERIDLSRNARWLDYGPDNYASTSWNGMPDGDKRRVSIGWMANIQYIGSIPTSPWRGQMTFPCELQLVDTPTGLRLAHKPIAEIASLRKRHLTRGEGSVADFNAWLATQDVPKVFECVLEIEVPESQSAGLFVGNATEKTSVTWDRMTRELRVDRTQSGAVSFHPEFPKIASAPIFQEGNRLKLHLIGDASSLEVFGGDGKATISSYVFPSPATKGLQFTGSGGVIIRSFDLWELGNVRPVKPDGLIAQWNFDEATPGTYAEATGNGTPMTAAPTFVAPAVVPGVAGNAMEVRRQVSPAQLSRLLAPAASSMMADSFTVSYHFNPKANDNAKLPQIRWQSPAGLAWGFEIFATRKMNFYVFDSKTANDVQSVASLPFEAFDSAANQADSLDNDPTWHHVAATYDALTGELTLFLNGVKASKSSTGLLGSPRYGTAGNGGGIQTGDGMTIFDDLRIYRGVLPDASIEFLRNHPGEPLPSTTPPPPLPPETSLHIERHGSSAFVYWPADTGAELWQSADLAEDSWTVIPGSRYTNSHASVVSHQPKLFFRLMETAN